jgi:hypothetical protein
MFVTDSFVRPKAPVGYKYVGALTGVHRPELIRFLSLSLHA